MIPRRDIILYNGLSTLISRWIFDSEKRSYPEKFEKNLSSHFYEKEIFLLGGGRQAFHLIFDNVDFEEGQEIIIPNYYLPVLIPIIKSKGLVPVFCDIDKNHLSSNKDQFLEKINEDTRFVIIPHIFGHMGKVKKQIEAIKDKKEDILIIEDCAHSLGSETKNGRAGTFGDFSLFSFNYIKTLSTLEGGALLVNNENYLPKIKKDYSANYQFPGRLKTVKKVIYYYFLLLVLKTPLLILLKIFLRNERIKKIIKRIHSSHSKNWRREKLSPFLSYIGYYEFLSFEKKQEEIDCLHKKYLDNLREDILEMMPKGEEVRWSKYFITLITEEEGAEISKSLFSKGLDVAVKDEVMGVCSIDEDLNRSLETYKKIIQAPLHHKLRKKEVEKISNKLNSVL